MEALLTGPRAASGRERPVSPFLADVLTGLSQPRKAIPARWFYDRRGSELFEEITRLPEYYPTRTEIALLTSAAAEIAADVGRGRVVVELGSGSSAKTPILLRAIDPAAYVPIDISGDFLRQSATALRRRMPGLDIHALEGDFTRPLILPRQVRDRPMLGFFPGSTIGNASAVGAVDLLRAIADTLGEKALLLIGIDRKKPLGRLLPAYDDARGVTAAFNLNLLHRINAELGGDIPVADFRHRAVWNEAEGRIEMHLEARRDLGFRIGGTCFAMRAGETIHTENSHKYSPEEAALLLRTSGWDLCRSWTDADALFGLYLVRRHEGSVQD